MKKGVIPVTPVTLSWSAVCFFRPSVRFLTTSASRSE